MDEERRRMDDQRLQELSDAMIELKVNQRHLVETLAAHTAEDHSRFDQVFNILQSFREDLNGLKISFKDEITELRMSIMKDKWTMIGAMSVIIPLITWAAEHYLG